MGRADLIGDGADHLIPTEVNSRHNRTSRSNFKKGRN